MSQAAEPLLFVRVQDAPHGMHVDSAGNTILHRDSLQRTRNTTHFAINGVVSNHVYGKFDGKIAIVADPAEMGVPAGFGQVDTWFHNDSSGNLGVGKAKVFAPHGTVMPEGVDVTYYADGPGAREAAVNEYLQSRGVEPRQIGMWGWVNVEADMSGQWEKQVTQRLYGPEASRIYCGPHSSSPDDKIETAMGLCAGALRSAAERYLVPDSTGFERPSTDVVEGAVADARAAIAAFRLAAPATVTTAAEGFLSGLEQRLRSCEEQNDKLREHYSRPFVLRDAAGTKCGPLDFDSLDRYGKAGGLVRFGEVSDLRFPERGWAPVSDLCPELARVAPPPPPPPFQPNVAAGAGAMLPPPLPPAAAAAPPPLPGEVGQHAPVLPDAAIQAAAARFKTMLTPAARPGISPAPKKMGP